MEIERLEIDANGLTFSARACGPSEGRPVLLLHGFPETSWGWRPALQALGERGYRAVAFDQRGYSPRARPKGVADYAIPHLVDDVLAVADTMEMSQFDLVGHDWGGMVGWVVAARHDVRVRSLAIVSTPHPLALRSVLESGDTEQRERSSYISLFRQADKPEQLLLGPDGSGEGFRKLFTIDGPGPGVDPSVVDEYLSVLSAPGALTAALNWYRAMDAGMLADLPPIVVPTLYVWSTGDVALGRAAAEATAKEVSGPYTFEVLDGVSHWVPEEAPEELNRLLLGHLATA